MNANERSLAKEITEGFEALKSMRNNEPVAWMQVHYKDNKPTKFSIVKTWEDDIPLYTHPVKDPANEVSSLIALTGQYKAMLAHPVELTDEEIDAVGDKVSNLIDTYAGRREFDRAILRKASEK